MSQNCIVCRHEKHLLIDQAMLEDQSYREMQEWTGLCYRSLHRHRMRCIPTELAQAKRARDIANANHLVNLLQAQMEENDAIKNAAKKTKDYRTAFAGNRENRRIIKLLGDFSVKLNPAPESNLVTSPEWIEVRTAILNALKPFPEASQAVQDAMDVLSSRARADVAVQAR